MRGDQTVGREQGRAINRDEQRERAAAAAEARAVAAASRGGGNPNKPKAAVAISRNDDGRPDVANPGAWN